MLGYKINKDLCGAGCINRYLHRLIVYHFCKPTDNDKNRIVTGALPMMSRYREQLQVSIVFPGNKFSSFLGSQLSSDNFSNVKQALTFPSTSSQPSSISALIFCLDIFFRSASPELK